MIRITKPSEIPTTEHWALIDANSVYIEGDERSRTAPGHGYPAHTVEYIDYLAFPSLESMVKEIERREEVRYSSSKPYKAIHVKPLNIHKAITVSVS